MASKPLLYNTSKYNKYIYFVTYIYTYVSFLAPPTITKSTNTKKGLFIFCFMLLILFFLFMYHCLVLLFFIYIYIYCPPGLCITTISLIMYLRLFFFYIHKKIYFFFIQYCYFDFFLYIFVCM